MMELAHSVGLKPRDAIMEVAVEDGESLLWQEPSVGDVHLQCKPGSSDSRQFFSGLSALNIVQIAA